MRKIIFSGLLLSLILMLAGCTGQLDYDYTEGQVLVNNVSIQVQVADEVHEITKGLMHRESLGEYEGMLFVFNNSYQRMFWMKNTTIPLDMIFIGENMQVINIEEADPCVSEPCKVYLSTAPAKYVLEVKQGFSKEHNVSPGNRILISI